MKSMKLSATFYLVVLAIAAAIPLAVGAFAKVGPSVLAMSLLGSAGVVALAAMLIKPSDTPSSAAMPSSATWARTSRSSTSRSVPT